MEASCWLQSESERETERLEWLVALQVFVFQEERSNMSSCSPFFYDHAKAQKYRLKIFTLILILTLYDSIDFVDVVSI